MPRMENIPCTMELHKHADGADTRFYTMIGPLVKNYLEKCLGVIRRGTYKAAYEAVSDLWPDLEPISDSIDDSSSDEGIKDQENLDDQ